MDSSCLTKGALWGTCCGVLLGAGDFMWYCRVRRSVAIGFLSFLAVSYGVSATCQLKRPYIGKGRPTFAEYKAELDNSLGSRG
ncbi:hypothetical protein FBUS_08211 [Fasciolopsis buskii]|uniref:Cytochrome c oxidase assembly protein COX20, mitochondrial n=1 Tax=Fasciolopsis buskii TaxID=27845 RepID=A0A8E0VN37_9TREM|nr:hypothetical protein FBUS_08211 [Fasciolopsis buski]